MVRSLTRELGVKKKKKKVAFLWYLNKYCCQRPLLSGNTEALTEKSHKEESWAPSPPVTYLRGKGSGLISVFPLSCLISPHGFSTSPREGALGLLFPLLFPPLGEEPRNNHFSMLLPVVGNGLQADPSFLLLLFLGETGRSEQYRREWGRKEETTNEIQYW